MRNLRFAAVLLALGGTGLVTSASAAPGMPMGVTAGDTVTSVRSGARAYQLNERKKERAYDLNSYKKERAYELNSRKKERAYEANSYKKYNRGYGYGGGYGYGYGYAPY